MLPFFFVQSRDCVGGPAVCWRGPRDIVSPSAGQDCSPCHDCAFQTLVRSLSKVLTPKLFAFASGMATCGGGVEATTARRPDPSCYRSSRERVLATKGVFPERSRGYSSHGSQLLAACGEAGGVSRTHRSPLVRGAFLAGFWRADRAGDAREAIRNCLCSRRFLLRSGFVVRCFSAGRSFSSVACLN